MEKGLAGAGHDVTLKKVELQGGKKIGWLKAGFSAGRQRDLPLATGGIDLSPYDRVVVGAPVWNWKGCPVTKTYLSSCEGLGGMTVYCFYSHAGNPGKSIETLGEQVAGMGARLDQHHMTLNEKLTAGEKKAALDRFVKGLK